MSAEERTTAEEDGPDLGPLLAGRLADYVDLWSGAAAKFADGTYRSEDLVDDWFALWGNMARDVTAGATVLWRAGQAAARTGSQTRGTGQ